MSTNGMDSWAVDLANVGAIYPFQGAEVLMVIIGVGLWLLWHIVQIKAENEELAEQERNADADSSKSEIDRY